MIAWIGQGKTICHQDRMKDETNLFCSCRATWSYMIYALKIASTYFADAGGLRRRYALLGEDGQELLRAGQT